MAKVTLENGMVFEGTNDELVELFTKLGAKIPTVEEAEPAPELLKVGEYAKVLATDGRDDEITVGEIRLIETNDESDCPYYAETLDGSNLNWFEAHELVRATDEEVAEAYAKLAEKALADKWASIYRKPNEFKKGDIVRGVRYNDTDDRFIGELEDENGDGYIGVRGGDGRYHAVRVGEATLITPVEARLDR